MKEFSPLLEYVSRHIHLDEHEAVYFCSLLKYTRVRKRHFLIQPDYVCKYQSYVTKGCLRAFITDDEGEDYTIQFAVEDWWIGDFGSFINQAPATMFVEAIEDSELIQIEYNAVQLLYKEVPKFERFFRIITQRSYVFSQKRIMSNISTTAEARYLDFITRYPNIATRVPQYTLASYLGITTEFLSKIRRRISKTQP